MSALLPVAIVVAGKMRHLLRVVIDTMNKLRELLSVAIAVVGRMHRLFPAATWFWKKNLLPVLNRDVDGVAGNGLMDNRAA